MRPVLSIFPPSRPRKTVQHYFTRPRHEMALATNPAIKLVRTKDWTSALRLTKSNTTNQVSLCPLPVALFIKQPPNLPSQPGSTQLSHLTEEMGGRKWRILCFGRKTLIINPESLKRSRSHQLIFLSSFLSPPTHLPPTPQFFQCGGGGWGALILDYTNYF